MNWEAVGAIGQMISAFAFVLALIQIRHLQTERQLALRRERVDRFVQVNMTSANNERLMSLRAHANEVLRAGKPLEHPFHAAATEELGISAADALTLQADQMARWSVVADMILSLPETPASERAQIERYLLSNIREPFFEFWFRHMSPRLNPDAVRYIGKLLAHAS